VLIPEITIFVGVYPKVAPEEDLELSPLPASLKPKIQGRVTVLAGSDVDSARSDK
jgi:hypothetical protein